MNSRFRSHVNRLKVALTDAVAAATIATWITTYTKLKGRNFSFKGHEYQETILNDPARVKYIKKCSQIGISELSVRKVLAFTQLYPGVTALYALPTATFAQTFAKTRVDVVIDSSPELTNSIFPGVDSTSVKRFLNDSFIYFKGMSKTSQAISIPVDDLTVDELDFAEDQAAVSNFTSRLTHSAFKNEMFLSTPTIPGYGISDKYEHCRQHVEMWKCSHCNHYFQPDYYNDVVLPGFEGDIKFFNKELLDVYDVNTAFLKCPKCGRKPAPGIENRHWVCKNDQSKHEAVGYHITPFCAPELITPGDLLRTSLKYKRHADFVNFGLGMELEDAETSVSKEELEKLFIPLDAPDSQVSVMGVDMGGMCAIHVGKVDPYGGIAVVHSEMVPLGKLNERRAQLISQYKVIAEVIDAMPYTDTVLRIQAQTQNCWAAVFSERKDLAMYAIKEVEEDPEKALDALKQIAVNRTRGFDSLVSALRNEEIVFKDGPMKEKIIAHMTDLKRIKVYSKTGEATFRWVKSAKEQDHLFFALLYMYLAAKVRTMSSWQAVLPLIAGKITPKKVV